jgi:hypothetical protein
MQLFGTILGIAGGLFLGALPAHASPGSTPDPAYAVPHVRETQANERSHPYARNYTDQMAQSLGLRDGQWEVFDAGPRQSLIPSLKGGLASGGPMLRLQWRP